MSDSAKDYEGRDENTGRFVAGNSVATRNKGKVKSQTQKLIDLVNRKQEQGLDWQEGLYDIATDIAISKDTRLKAKKIIADIVCREDTKIVVEYDGPITAAECDAAILEIFGNGQTVSIAPEVEADADE